MQEALKLSFNPICISYYNKLGSVFLLRNLITFNPRVYLIDDTQQP